MTEVENTPTLEVRSLTVRYRRKPQAAVDDVSFQIAQGESVALVGESGSGKTTTAMALLGLLAPGAVAHSAGILLGSEDISRYRARKLRTIRGSRVGIIPQDPGVSLNPVHRIGDQIAEVFRIHLGAGRTEAQERALRVLDEVGLPEPAVRARQFPHELSGGMKQRVLIGIALAARPELVIADEPTSALDVTVQRTVLDRLQELTAQARTSVLLITHDLAVAAERTDRIIVMKDGGIVEQGRTDRILQNAESRYTKTLLAAAPSLNSQRLVASSSVAEPVQEFSAPAFVRVDNLVKRYPSPSSSDRHRVVDAVRDISFSIDRGTTFALVGESGSGKSTTARMVSRFVEPTSGSIVINGESVTDVVRHSDRRRLRRDVQLVYQNPFSSLDPRYTISKIVEEPLWAFGIGSRATRRTQAATLLDQVGLSSSVSKMKPHELSGGQRQRVAIARALALTPRFLVLDEPVSALDVSVQAQVLQLLVDLQQAHNLTYLFISHDLAVVRQISDTIGVMRNGELVEVGPALDVLGNPESEYTKSLLSAVPGSAAASPVTA